MNIALITTLGIILISIFIIYNYQKDKKLKEIQNYLSFQNFNENDNIRRLCF